jgi:hypothetical protein
VNRVQRSLDASNTAQHVSVGRPWGHAIHTAACCLLFVCWCVCRQHLRELRDYQQQIKLFDESAEEIVRDATRKQVRHTPVAWLMADHVQYSTTGGYQELFADTRTQAVAVADSRQQAVSRVHDHVVDLPAQAGRFHARDYCLVASSSDCLLVMLSRLGMLLQQLVISSWLFWQQLHEVSRHCGLCSTACRRKVLQGGHAATLQRTLGKRDCSQNDKMDRGGISPFTAALHVCSTAANQLYVCCVTLRWRAG